ncbi:hypothetical protein [Vibrio campbellii]|uniref:hypothetical protein n=1 Tax=Vibrio campbellii TaxID=680 RepID=UPI00210B8582|nr:hypothetical protein [Vibrio campbellii]
MKSREGMLWSMSISELYDLKASCLIIKKHEHFKRKPNQKCHVVMFQNQKGGVGKTYQPQPSLLV